MHVSKVSMQRLLSPHLLGFRASRASITLLPGLQYRNWRSGVVNKIDVGDRHHLVGRELLLSQSLTPRILKPPKY